MSYINSYGGIRHSLQFYEDSFIGGHTYRYPRATVLNSQTLWDNQLLGVDETPGLVAVGSCNSYLIPHEGESRQSFSARLALSVSIPLCSPVVDAYASAVSSKVQRDLGKLENLLEDVDYQGSSYEEFMYNFTVDCAIFGFCFAIVDTNGLLPKIVTIRPTQVAWLEVDETGKIIEFAYVTQATYAPELGLNFQRIYLRVWNGSGWSECYGDLNLSHKEIIDQKEKLKVVSQGPLDPRHNGAIPVVVGYYQKDNGQATPSGFSLIRSVAESQMLIYNKLSWAADQHRKIGFSMLVVPVDGSGGQMPPDTKRQIGLTKAFPYPSAAGTPDYISPKSDPTIELRDDVKFLISQAYDSVGLISALDQTGQTVSGINLRVRARDFDSNASKFAKNMRKFEQKLLALVSLVSGVDNPEYSVVYPTKFTLPDFTETAQTAALILSTAQQNGIDIGAEGKTETLMSMIGALPLTDEVLSSIKETIKNNLTPVPPPVSVPTPIPETRTVVDNAGTLTPSVI